eukprot:6214500-Pleurochrysis_carterae.AAC.11
MRLLFLFDDCFRASTVHRWHRVGPYQLHALKLLAEFLLRKNLQSTPAETLVQTPAERFALCYRGELSAKKMAFATDVFLTFSEANVGADKYARQLARLYSKVHVRGDRHPFRASVDSICRDIESVSRNTTQAANSNDNSIAEANANAKDIANADPDTNTSNGTNANTKAMFSFNTDAVTDRNSTRDAPDLGNKDKRRFRNAAFVERLPVRRQSTTPKLLLTTDAAVLNSRTVFLLLLNRDTFVGPTAEALANKVREMRAAKTRMLLVHEDDENRRGCPFSR